LKNAYFPGDAQIDEFVRHYNHRRDYECLKKPYACRCLLRARANYFAEKGEDQDAATRTTALAARLNRLNSFDDGYPERR